MVSVYHVLLVLKVILVELSAKNANLETSQHLVIHVLLAHLELLLQYKVMKFVMLAHLERTQINLDKFVNAVVLVNHLLKVVNALNVSQVLLQENVVFVNLAQLVQVTLNLFLVIVKHVKLVKHLNLVVFVTCVQSITHQQRVNTHVIHALMVSILIQLLIQIHAFVLLALLENLHILVVIVSNALQELYQQVVANVKVAQLDLKLLLIENHAHNVELVNILQLVVNVQQDVVQEVLTLYH